MRWCFSDKTYKKSTFWRDLKRRNRVNCRCSCRWASSCIRSFKWACLSVCSLCLDCFLECQKISHHHLLKNCSRRFRITGEANAIVIIITIAVWTSINANSAVGKAVRSCVSFLSCCAEAMRQARVLAHTLCWINHSCPSSKLLSLRLHRVRLVRFAVFRSCCSSLSCEIDSRVLSNDLRHCRSYDSLNNVLEKKTNKCA